MIHPSLVEGFGLPIVEAQCLGTPVAASRSSAVPEVAGKGAIYFDPLNRDDMARRIAEVAGEETLRSRLAAAGRENILRFSWRETAHTVLSVYERLA